MATPIKRNGIYYYKVDVPSAFKKLAKGSLCSVQVAGERTTIRVGGVFQVSLRTKDIAEAKQRFAAVAVQAAQHYEGLSNGPTTLTHKKSLAIAGAIRAVWIDAFDEDPGAVGLWKSVMAHDAAALSGTSNPLAVPTDETIAQDIEARFGPMIDAFLLREALRLDVASRAVLLSHVVAAMSEVTVVNAGKAAGDYSDRGATHRYPAYTKPSPAQPSAPLDVPVTFGAVIDRKVAMKAAGRGGKPLSRSTINKYKLAAGEFDKHRRDTGILTATRAAGEAWKDAMLAEGKLSNRSIGQRVVNVGTVWTWAQKQGHIPETIQRNPLGDVDRPDYEQAAPDDKTYRMDEARQILKAALKETKADLRWLPWLCAYTGARVNELSPLTPNNVFEYEGEWFLRITTKGGRSLKNNFGERRVPIHPDILEQGFVAWAHNHTEKDERMFTTRAAANVGDWLKETVGVDREGLAPNHAWRHLFEDLAVGTGMPESVKLYMTGRSGGGSAAGYGKSQRSLPDLAKFMRDIPSFLDGHL